MRAFLSPLEFVRLENFCAVQDGKHKSGGVQNRRRAWKAQLDARRGHLTMRERVGRTPVDDRYIDLDDDDIEFIRRLRANPRAGGWQRDLLRIFGGVAL